MEQTSRLLERLATEPFESCETEWRKLLRSLRLGLAYVIPIQEVLRAGRWRGKANPLGYIRTAGVRTAVRMGLVDRNPRHRREVLACELKYTDWDGEELEHDEKLDQAQHESNGKHYVPGCHTHVVDRVFHALLTDDLEVDWEMVADLAGLDEAERLVLLQRAMGFTREMALKSCFSAKDRRIVAAAWKRLKTRRKTLRKVLETGRPAGVNRETKGPKMLFLLGDDGELKIFFAKNVPEGEKICM